VLQTFVNESALCLSLDVLRLPGAQEWTTTLTLASNSQVVVVEKSTQDGSYSQLFHIENISDNVSCVKTVYIGETKQIWTFIATFNGRLQCKLIKQLPDKA